MMYPLVQELAGEGIPVTATCGVLGFSTQAFYKWQADPICDRDFDDAHLERAPIQRTSAEFSAVSLACSR